MSSMVMDGVAARSRSTDPVTSVDAGRSVNVCPSQEYVFGILEDEGPLADHELLSFHSPRVWPWSPQRVRSARAELVEQGRVEFSGIYRLTDSGRKARVWQVVPD